MDGASVSPAPVRLSAVRAAVERHWGHGSAPQRLLLLASAPQWDGPDEVDVGPLSVQVRAASSPLAIRELLATHGQERLVVLTDVDEAALGRDVLAAAVRFEVVVSDQWEDVRMAFAMPPTAPIDPGLVRLGAPFARALISVRPAMGWSPAASGILTREHVMRQMAVSLVGLPADRIDGAGLLEWSTDVQGGLSLRDLADDVRTPFVTWLRDKTGLGTKNIIDLVLRGDGDVATPLGILTALAWGRAGGRRDGRAQGLIEGRLGSRPTEQEIDAWWSLVDGWLGRQAAVEPERVASVLRETDRLAEVLNLGESLGDDDLLPSSLHRRLARAAHVLATAAEDPSSRNLLIAEQAAAHALRHRARVVHQPALDVIAMALRVVRWISTSPRPLGDLAESLRWQIEMGGWVDRARQAVANGTSDPSVGAWLERVHGAASIRRAQIDAAAARQLAHAVETDQDPGSLVPVEDALRTLRPAADSGVLLVVVDGMSAAVASELCESVRDAGWVEVAPGGGGRQGLLAGLPTMTEVSRASLLAGRRTRGGQDVERRGVKEVLGDGSRIFHKADLVPAPGHDIARPVREAILDADVPVVVAVLNTVDDSLSSGSPGSTAWTVGAVAHLQQLLDHAGAAGRAVVLTSDHGHVVDREPGTLRMSEAGSGRWRPVDGVVHEDEVHLSGARVQLAGGAVVAAVGEGLRYGRRSAGYHGGAALAELAIPWVVLVRRGVVVPGHSPAPDATPSWWNAAAPAAEDSSDALF